MSYKSNKIHFWTPHRLNTLEELWGEETAKVIAGKLGCSRNAVIGKAHRMELPESKFRKWGYSMNGQKKSRIPAPDDIRDIRAYAVKQMSQDVFMDLQCIFQFFKSMPKDVVRGAIYIGMNKKWLERRDNTWRRCVSAEQIDADMVIYLTPSLKPSPPVRAAPVPMPAAPPASYSEGRRWYSKSRKNEPDAIHHKPDKGIRAPVTVGGAKCPYCMALKVPGASSCYDCAYRRAA